MNTTHIFFRLISTDLKRLKKYIWQVLISVLLLLTVCGAAGILISKNIYKTEVFQSIQIAYYIPEDDDMRYNSLAIGMLGEMQSMQEAATLIQASTIDEGYSMLERGEILYFIIVPPNFFSGIMDSTNPPLDIILRDNSSISAYIANELFLSYAKYLGIAQAGIYSALDTVRSHNLDSDTVHIIQDRVNLTYLNRALDKDGYITSIEATGEGGHTLTQHYTASALMLSMFFVAFVLMPFLQGYNQGMMLRLSSSRIKSVHLMISRAISTFAALYIAYIPCLAIISVYNSHFNIAGITAAVPAIIIISVLISVISTLSNSIFTGNIMILITAVVIAYIGGGILPTAMLPSIIQNTSDYLPFRYIISCLARALFG